MPRFSLMDDAWRRPGHPRRPGLRVSCLDCGAEAEVDRSRDLAAYACEVCGSIDWYPTKLLDDLGIKAPTTVTSTERR